MGSLVVVGFPKAEEAEQVRRELVDIQREQLIALEDAVVVEHDAEGRVHLHQALNLTTAGAVGGGFWGTLVGFLAGEAGMGFYSVSATLPHVKAGRLRALATTGAKRSPSLPDLPTAVEAGVPGFETGSWAGVLSPAGTPRVVMEKLHRELVRVLQLPDVRERLAAIDFEPVGNTPEQFGALIKEEVARWAKVVKASGAKVD